MFNHISRRNSDYLHLYELFLNIFPELISSISFSDHSQFTLKLPSTAEVGTPLNVSIDVQYKNQMGFTIWPPQHMSASGMTPTPFMALSLEGDEKIELNKEVQLTLTVRLPAISHNDMELMVRCIDYRKFQKFSILDEVMLSRTQNV